MQLYLVLLFSYLFVAFFYSVKVLFTRIWTEAGLNVSTFHRKAFKKCQDQKSRSREIHLAVGLGKIIFSALFILTLLKLFHLYHLYDKAISIKGAACFLLSVLIHTIFGKLLPKTLSKMLSEKLIAPFYYLYRIWDFLLLPFTLLFSSLILLLYKLFSFEERLDFLSQKQRSKLKGNNGDAEELDEQEREMIYSIFKLGETEVSEIMVPRPDTIAVDEEGDINDIIAIIKKYGHSRIPVYKKNIDSITGLLNVKDLLKFVDKNHAGFHAKSGLKSIIRPPFFVPENKKINELFQEMKKEKVHMAIVVDEYGGTAGIVTLEDIIEEIVGEIQDEYDHEEALFKRIDKNTIELDPKINIADLNKLLHTNLDTENSDYDTLGGLIFTQAGYIPAENYELFHEDLKITILKMDGQRIEKVRIEIQKANP
jgi:putative hemolysin